MKVIFVDVENDLIEILIEMFKLFDKVIFLVGFGGNMGVDKIIIVDLDGVVKLMIVSKEVNIKYYVMVLIYDLRCQVFDDSGDLKLYIIVKYYVDDYLRCLGLNYIILYLGVFINVVGFGKIEVV